ncbi:hypothetical protein GF359_09525 [candidate division WOR-3 bacterium]|uniref:Tetratricopeptide repeat protein n=1 Tax=candidate division WOR-3 bacterium TaxID=2052148 RepID=A0A9D5KAS6_UNCW3|nr:hypothetical protein [candidate division WOR-3 bacterium]MBD3365438.1 hypothetical protein [candidate division WOR-3 bacterium]
MNPDTLFADTALADTLLADTLTADTLKDTVAAAARTTGIPPLVWIIIAAVVVVAVVILVIVLLAGGRRRAKSPHDAYIDGLRALLDGDEVTAAKEFRDSVLKDTENIDAYIRLGKLMRENGNAEKASQIHQALTARPSLSRKEELRIYEELLADYSALQRTEKSIALLKEMLRIDPRDTGYLHRLLGALISRSRTDEALEVIKSHRKAFSSKEEQAIWYAEIARLLYSKDEEAAEDVLKLARRRARNHPCIQIVKARGHINKGEWKKAKKQLDKFLADHPMYAEKVLDLLEKVYFEHGSYNKLRPVYVNILDRFPEKHQVRLRLIRLYAKQAKYKQADALIREGLAENPSDAVLIMEQLSLKLAEKDLKGAEETFSKLTNIMHLMPELCPECGCELAPDAWVCVNCGYLAER